VTTTETVASGTGEGIGMMSTTQNSGWIQAGLISGAALLGAFVAPAVQAADAPANWASTIKFSGYVDAGIMGNTTGSTQGVNVGRLFDDRANRLELNQASIVVTRPTDPNATGYDFGFTFQPMYGSDARYTHLLGVFDRSSDTRNQFTFIELDALLHLPWLTEGGVDAKLGIFPSSLSAETTVPATNPFYSHSYIFNFGVTVAHTGAFTETHLNPMIDIYLGIDSGNQTTWFNKGDNNSSPAGWAGIGLNFLDGNITTLWLNHFGPENPTGTRNLNGSTITTIVKWNDDLTFTTDLNFARDAGFNANAYGIAQYASYAINDMLTLQARAEVWRDDKGFFLAAFPGSLDPVNALAGRPNGSLSAFPTPLTMAEFTLGLNVKPPLPDRLGIFSGLMLRPEVRYDTSTNSVKLFNNGRSKDNFTIGTDLIVPF
jgi:hypothetical protein